MYPVSNRFHTLAIQDAPTTRVRIYFIDDTVDCTDDNDVQTNGTLLVGAVGDTDSNGRISEAGITFNEFFNPEKNIYVGDCVSSQISMTLLNYDGALDGYTFGRCKVYLDVYDEDNSVWLSCPMGVYLVEQPIRTQQNLISVHGFDQMQKLDQSADAWWSALNWTNGLTLYDMVASMASNLGLSVSASTQTSMVNLDISYKAPPFDAKKATYRQILQAIGEASATSARFDRDGAIEMRWFKPASVNNNTVTIDADTIGNQCLSIDIAEYGVERYETLYGVWGAVKQQAVMGGPETNKYTIIDNWFINPMNQDVTDVSPQWGVLDRIIPVLYSLPGYSPIRSRIIWDWSLESGDIITIVRNSIAYSLPIFQQSMKWRGGYVVSELFSDGDVLRPEGDTRSNSELPSFSEENRGVEKESLGEGWYRAIAMNFPINFSPSVQDGRSGVVLNINITNIGVGESSENITIQYRAAADGNGFFTGEVSNRVGNYYGIDAIRCMRSSDSYFIDVHVFSAARGVRVDFESFIIDALQAVIVPAGLNSVADAPTGETIQSEHFFSRISQNESVKISRMKGEVESDWYRFAIYNGSNAEDLLGAAGAVLHINVVRNSDTYDNETHSIDLNLVKGNIKFSNECSVSNTLKIDKIRYATDADRGYLYVHCNEMASSEITVDFTVAASPEEKGKYAAVRFVKFTPYQPEQTVQAEYTFSANKVPGYGGGQSASATLSSSGWYRAVVYNAYDTYSAQGTSGEIVDINIVWTATDNCGHHIKLFLDYGKVAFLGEESHGTYNIVDKIRYTYNGSVGYIDIHFVGVSSGDIPVHFAFDVTTRSYAAPNWISGNLESVADAPSGETVLTTHEFAAVSKTPVRHGTANGWDYVVYADKTIEATKVISSSMSYYTTVGGFYGYYQIVNTPFTMADTSYYVDASWRIGNGLGITAGFQQIQTTRFNVYALGTAHGTSESFDLYLFLKGTIA